MSHGTGPRHSWSLTDPCASAHQHGRAGQRYHGRHGPFLRQSCLPPSLPPGAPMPGEVYPALRVPAARAQLEPAGLMRVPALGLWTAARSSSLF